VNESDATDLLTALYNRWYMALVRYALRTTRNYEIAEDLAQDTFMQLYQALRLARVSNIQRRGLFAYYASDEQANEVPESA